jgi:hypothetical protein
MKLPTGNRRLIECLKECPPLRRRKTEIPFFSQFTFSNRAGALHDKFRDRLTLGVRASTEQVLLGIRYPEIDAL